MTAEAESHSTGHSLLNWLKPDRNPFYLVTIACIFTITFLAEKEVVREKWNFLFFLVAFILLLNMALSLFPQQIENEEYDKNLRFARTLGIMSATISLVFLKKGLETPLISINWIFILIIIQVAIFSLFLFLAILKKAKKAYSQKKKINNFQLCLITSSLLMGIVVNFNLSIESDIFDKSFVYKENLNSDVKNIEEEVSSIIKQSTRNNNLAIMDTIDLNVFSSNILHSLRALKSTDYTEEKSDRASRHEAVVNLLIIPWIICILCWAYQLRGVVNIRINPDYTPE